MPAALGLGTSIGGFLGPENLVRIDSKTAEKMRETIFLVIVVGFSVPRQASLNPSTTVRAASLDSDPIAYGYFAVLGPFAFP